MNALLLITTLLCITLREVASKAYTRRISGGIYTYTMLTGIGTIFFFLITSADLRFDVEILPYSVWFGASYLLASIFLLKAIAVGSLSLTALVTNCSLILPTLYGLVFLHEKGSLTLYLGIVLLIAALILVNKTSVSEPINIKWLVYVTIAFLGNGMCTISQKAQQLAFDGEGKNELMILALAIVVFVNFILAMVYERKEIVKYGKAAAITGVPGGLSNGVVNLFVMILLGRMPTSTVFPLISGGGIVLTHIVSRTVYKEKLSKKQTIGFILGIMSVVLLNL